jgi:hypothetical protein
MRKVRSAGGNGHQDMVFAEIDHSSQADVQIGRGTAVTRGARFLRQAGLGCFGPIAKIRGLFSEPDRFPETSLVGKTTGGQTAKCLKDAKK